MWVMLIGGDPVAVHEDRSILESCAEGTTEADLEVRNEVREIVVQELGGSRDPLFKRMRRAARERSEGNAERAKEILGWD